MSTEQGTALVVAARKGNARAQDELVAAYLPLVYNIVGRALNGHHDTDDVVQDTMLRALDGLPGLRAPESFRSWLVAIAMNRVRAHTAARQAYQATAGAGGLEQAFDVADPGADFVDLTVVRLNLSGQRMETAEATRWLEPEDRALLSLWWLECAGELTRPEVAAAMELSPQHTAVRVQRMKAQLEAARVVVRALRTEPPCPALSAGLESWDGVPSALWRKRIARHARDCVRCSGLWSGLFPAEGLLAGLALVAPAAGLMTAVRGGGAATMAPVGHASTAAGHGAAAGGVGGATSAGGRGALRRQRQRGRRRVAVAGAAAVVAVSGGAYHLFSGPEEPGGEAVRQLTAPAAPASVRSSRVAPTPERSPSPSASPSVKPSVSPSASPSASPTPRPSVTRKPPKATPKPAPTTARPKPTKVGGGSGGASGTAGKVISLVNEERARAGCGPLTNNAKLADAAQAHSDDMAARDYFDHTNPDGAGPGERITAAGYAWSTYGENIARGQQTAASVMESWMNSSGHRANILNCSFKEIGVGIHSGSGGPWWTQNFGAR
ncbi:sigma-70 family RNA polymerase sigma factor [Streptomyces sp. NPDC097619]|uniref:sigma-70 family RNA polymerase sigma factor n=1 Tax=Streptomyces sp. NPDC097619 TaxID=3157228 RepID=UPI0033231455